MARERDAFVNSPSSKSRYRETKPRAYESIRETLNRIVRTQVAFAATSMSVQFAVYAKRHKVLAEAHDRVARSVGLILPDAPDLDEAGRPMTKLDPLRKQLQHLLSLAEPEEKPQTPAEKPPTKLGRRSSTRSSHISQNSSLASSSLISKL